MFAPRLSPVSVLTALVGAAAAWDLTFYNNMACDGSDDADVYKIFEGDSTDCHEIIAGEEGASCQEYTDGGHEGPNPW